MTTQETNVSETTMTEDNETGYDTGQKIVGGLMIWVGIRCTLQYVVLPFLLPLIGLSSAISLWLSVGVSLFALCLMGFNLRRLWDTNWRWRYLTMSAIAGAIVVMFLYLDIQELLGA